MRSNLGKEQLFLLPDKDLDFLIHMIVNSGNEHDMHDTDY